MAERVVIDASIAIALVRQEPRSPRILTATRQWADVGTELLVPSHFWVEVMNVLVRRYRRTEPEVIEDLATLDDLLLRTVEVDRPMLLLGLVAMTQAGLSAYDALYLALALSTEARLATLDRRLATAAGDRALLIAEGKPRGLDESRVPYGRDLSRDPAWLRSAAVGAYIAELRRRASVTVGEGRG